MVMVWDANQKGAFGAGHMAIVVTDWARTHLGASGKSPLVQLRDEAVEHYCAAG
jgi:hypothetical protein